MQYRLIYENYFKTIGNLKLGLYSELHLSNQNNFANYTASLLAAPAFQPTPDSKTQFNPLFRAYNYAGFGLKTIYLISKNFDFRIEGYVFQPYQEIIQNSDLTASLGQPFQNRNYMAMAALVFQTPVGPVSLSLNYYDLAERYENRFCLLSVLVI